MISVKHSVTFAGLVFLCQGWITWIAVRLPLEGDPAPPGAPWPMPKEWTNSNSLWTMDATNFLFQTNAAGCDVIQKAIERYKDLIVLHKNGKPDNSLPLLEALDIQITNTTCNLYPDFEQDESYTLQISSSPIAQMTSQTIWGALRGLETFSQLIHLTDEERYQVNQTRIDDAPRYRYRGLMIDTSRHFLSMKIILQILDAMSWDKFNVLHWHAVDDQSFPYPSRTFPELSEKGAYSAHHRYSRDDVTTILEQARLRGIQVIPEFDTPGHTWSWGRAYPDLITPCWGNGTAGGPYVPDYPNHGPAEIMNPMSEFTYTFLKQFYQEIIEDFPSSFVHLGMDEVYYACWKSSPNISAWMSEMNFTEYNEIEQYYAERLIDIVSDLDSNYIIWQDPVDNNVTVHPDTLVTVWKDVDLGAPGQFSPWETYMAGVAAKGYHILLAAPWYLNYITYGQDYKKYYEVEPTNFTSDPNEQALIWGGQACIWAEYVDGANILSLLWPRASAVAERLWSPKEVDDVEEAKYRLDQQRCRMLRRGIPTKPILNGYCGDYEWGMQDEDPVPPEPPESGAGLLRPKLITLWTSLIFYLSLCLWKG